MSLENRFRDFQTEYNLDDEAMGKMLGLFNDAFIDVARKLLETNTSNTGNVKKTTTVNKTTSSSSFVKRLSGFKKYEFECNRY